MRFSFACILSFFLLVTTAAAIPAPRVGHPLSRRDSYDDVVELHARAKKAPPPHHPSAWGKTQDKKLPTKSKEQRKADHKVQQAVAGKRRHRDHVRKQKNLNQGKAAPEKWKKEGRVARKQAVVAKKKKVQAKAKSTQLEAKQKLAQRKAAGRQKFDETRRKYCPNSINSAVTGHRALCTSKSVVFDEILLVPSKHNL